MVDTRSAQRTSRRGAANAEFDVDATPPTAGRRFVGRMLEAAFRRPLLCLLPLVLFGGLGVWSVTSSEDSYVSSGVISVASQTLLSDLSNLPGSEGFGWETPAGVTSRNINELLGTDEFARLLADSAGYGSLVESGVVQLDAVRSAVVAVPTGANLVTIRASTDDPESAYRIAGATIDTYIEWVLEGDVNQSVAAELFFTNLLEVYEADVATAREALAQYVAANPPLPDGTRPAEEEAEIARLDADIEVASTRATSAVQNIEDARLSTEQTASDIGQRLRVVDEPRSPLAPESSRIQMVMTFAMYVVAGFVFSLGLVLAGAALDRTLRNVDDVETMVGQGLLAAVPEGR